MQKPFGIKKNNVISTKPFALLVTCFEYYPVPIIKPLYVKISSNFIKSTLEQIITDNT